MDNVWIYCGYMAMAAFAGWILFRGIKTGVLHSENASFDRDAQPLGYAVQFGLLVVLIVFCLQGMGHVLGIAPDPMLMLHGRFA